MVGGAGGARGEDASAIWFDPQIKAVVICSKRTGGKLILAAAKSGKHIYAEKPLGMGARTPRTRPGRSRRPASCSRPATLCAHPNVQFIREQLARGEFGKVTRVRGSNCHGGALEGWFDTDWRWMADPKVAGIGAFGDLGTHSLDLLLMLSGNVSRTTAAVSATPPTGPGCDEGGEGMMIFDNGTLGSLVAGWDDVADPVTLEISGTEGHATSSKVSCSSRASTSKGPTGRNRGRSCRRSGRLRWSCSWTPSTGRRTCRW